MMRRHLQSMGRAEFVDIWAREALICPDCSLPLEEEESPFMNELGEPDKIFWKCPECGYTTKEAI